MKRLRFHRAWSDGLGALLVLLTVQTRAATLTTLEGKSFAGKISVEPGAFVITTADATMERVPLANVRSVAFDRVAAVAKAAEWSGHSVGTQPVLGSFLRTNDQVIMVGSGSSWSVERGHFFVQQEIGEVAQLTAFATPAHK